MKVDITTRETKGTKALFIDVMNLSKKDRLEFIEQNTPHLNPWLKKAALNS